MHCRSLRSRSGPGSSFPFLRTLGLYFHSNSSTFGDLITWESSLSSRTGSRPDFSSTTAFYSSTTSPFAGVIGLPDFVLKKLPIVIYLGSVLSFLSFLPPFFRTRRRPPFGSIAINTKSFMTNIPICLAQNLKICLYKFFSARCGTISFALRAKSTSLSMTYR